MIRLPRIHVAIPLKTSVHAFVPEYEVPLVLAKWRIEKRPTMVNYVGERGPHVAPMPAGMRPEALVHTADSLETERARLRDERNYGAEIFDLVYPNNAEDTFAAAFRKAVEKEALNPFNPEKALRLEPSPFLTKAGLGEKLALELTKRGYQTPEAVVAADFLKLCEIQYLTPASARELQNALKEALAGVQPGEDILIHGFGDTQSEPAVTGSIGI